MYNLFELSAQIFNHVTLLYDKGTSLVTASVNFLFVFFNYTELRAGVLSYLKMTLAVAQT